ncbi:hypothetical protein BU25DRAFT_409505 [Macroventuria anomochaeta]|uniref:Uncharacterized protein n=1 Tax=Macroventuria anomochaeta TaxID=301207 RepID=A0ACB6S7C8_9PLEO|nr:uncharacterized protein BU25DRAFT_409505 [Macroventuria anomochaeta]KAF2629032.1 hypothetical protein BU25DRAFT_409505 [Macroventuria anomochaeta]
MEYTEERPDSADEHDDEDEGERLPNEDTSNETDERRIVCPVIEAYIVLKASRNYSEIRFAQKRKQVYIYSPYGPYL